MNLAVFGGSTGIGAAVVEIAAPDAERITIADIKLSEAWRFSVQHENVSVFECDATDESDVFTAFVDQEYDTIVCTVGAQIAKPFGELEPVDHSDMWRANYLAPANIVRQAMFHLNSASIVLVSSIAGLTSGGPGLTAYGAAKAATISLTKTLAQELAPHFRINCVCPGWTDTPFNGPVIEQMGGRKTWERKIRKDVPLKRAAEPYEIARAILDVASWPYATGSVVVVDGGLSL